MKTCCWSLLIDCTGQCRWPIPLVGVKEARPGEPKSTRVNIAGYKIQLFNMRYLPACQVRGLSHLPAYGIHPLRNRRHQSACWRPSECGTRPSLSWWWSERCAKCEIDPRTQNPTPQCCRSPKAREGRSQTWHRTLCWSWSTIWAEEATPRGKFSKVLKAFTHNQILHRCKGSFPF